VRRIVVDDTAFSKRRFGPGYDPDGPGLSYMAPSGALSLQFNVLEITARPGPWGEAVAIEVDPPCAHVRIESTAQTGKGRPLVIDTARVEDHTVVRVQGSLAAGHAPVVVRKRVADPALFAGTAFADVLARISEGEPLPVSPGRVPEDATTLHIHRSAPLPDVMSPGLKFSNNFTTEQILRTLGWRLTGRPGDWRGGREALERFWAALGQDPDLLVFENASGLSRTGRLTPRSLVDLLALTAREGSHAAAVLPALPVSGRDGTLRRRLVSSDGRVRAKTGTLSGVGALSGIVASEDGSRRLAFSILVNGGLGSQRTRRIQDRVVLALVDHIDGE
jgi:D-alanyl-D-alanine carboxypeptidase/D-alanyl-D-alanine-endopeptidase (penicillin-binding protein 4)